MGWEAGTGHLNTIPPCSPAFRVFLPRKTENGIYIGSQCNFTPKLPNNKKSLGAPLFILLNPPKALTQIHIFIVKNN